MQKILVVWAASDHEMTAIYSPSAMNCGTSSSVSIQLSPSEEGAVLSVRFRFRGLSSLCAFNARAGIFSDSSALRDCDPDLGRVGAP